MFYVRLCPISNLLYPVPEEEKKKAEEQAKKDAEKKRIAEEAAEKKQKARRETGRRAVLRRGLWVALAEQVLVEGTISELSMIKERGP